MSNRLSGTTDVIALRMPKEVVAILNRRASKQGKRVSEYVRARLQYDTMRSHKRKVRDG